MSVSEPGKIITPWAESGLKNTIPPTANPATGRAGFDQGFSAINMTAKEAGGIPPFGQDFNGIFYEVTNILRYMQAGGQPTFSSALATAIGGYPKGAMVLGSDGVTLWQSKIESNSVDPDIDPSSWGTFDIGLKADLASGAGASLVSYALQSGSPVVNLSTRLAQRVCAVDAGGTPSDAATNTLRIQLAIDFVYAAGGGTVDLGPYAWEVSASPLNETYDNYGVPVAASTGCVILRKGVSLIGQPGRTKLYTINKKATLIYMIAPAGNVVSGFEIDGGWNPGDTGGNNGIFTLATTGGIDKACDRVTFSDLYIRNVASYGLALQNGNPRGCSIARIRIDNIGADGLDLKARGDLAVPAQANSAEDIWVSRHNQRVDGSAGVDVRGIWHLRGITVTDFGGDPTRTYVGIRFRTKPAPIDPQQVADKTTLTGFIIRPTIGSAALNIAGIECGSDDTHINNGYVEDCHHGVIHTGNVNGSAIRGTVTDVTSANARQYGFRNAGGTQGIKYVGCEDVGAVTAGFRIEGDNCTAVGCTGTLSVSSGALPTFLQTGCKFGASFVVLERQTDTSVSVTAKGTAADIALRLSVKGTSFVGFNGDLRPDTANTKYLGSFSLPMAGGFTQTAFTVTSDADYKTDPIAIDEVLLDVADEVGLFKYQYLDRVEEKGVGGARWHFGGIAQHFIKAIERRGVDWSQFAFLCYDEWDGSPTVYDDDGNVVSPAVEAGGKYGIRYEEYLVLKSEALARRDRLQQAEIDELKDVVRQLAARVGEIDGK